MLLHHGARPDALRIHSTQRKQEAQSAPLYEAVTESEKYLVNMLLDAGTVPRLRSERRVLHATQTPPNPKAQRNRTYPQHNFPTSYNCRC